MNKKKNKKTNKNTSDIRQNTEDTIQSTSADAEPAEKKVTLYTAKRNAFYKLGYNENHIPH